MWTIDETMVTTRIITPDSVSSRNAHCTSRPPETIHCANGTIWVASWWMTCGSCAIRSAADSSIAPQVTSCAPRSPIARPKKPEIAAASKGRKTMRATTCLASHHVDVGNLDRPAVAEIDDKDGETDRRLGGGNGQYEHREDLADQIVQDHREGDEVDVDREQHQFDRHHDDDDVLAGQKDTAHPERKQDRCDCQVMREADRHAQSPTPGRAISWPTTVGATTPWPSAPLPTGTLTTATASARVRANWAGIYCRRVPGLCRRVSTMAPVIAISRITPAA